MDTMARDFEGLMQFLLAMLAAMSLAVALVAAWAGRRRIGLGQWRRALGITNALIVLNAVTLGAVMLRTEAYPDNPWQWVWVFVTAPMLVGYGAGTTLGLLRRGRAD